MVRLARFAQVYPLKLVARSPFSHGLVLARMARLHGLRGASGRAHGIAEVGADGKRSEERAALCAGHFDGGTCRPRDGWPDEGTDWANGRRANQQGEWGFPAGRAAQWLHDAQPEDYSTRKESQERRPQQLMKHIPRKAYELLFAVACYPLLALSPVEFACSTGYCFVVGLVRYLCGRAAPAPARLQSSPK
jgi:hypothetical protein